MPAERPPRVEPAAAEATHDLRRRVLREGTPDAVVVYPEDAWEGAFHLVARPGPGMPPLGVATFFPEPTDLRPGRRAWRLRGMAVDVGVQSRGYGRALIDAAVAALASRGAEVCWANARDSALGFYVRLGFSVEGDGFAIHGRPHHRVVVDLPAPGGVVGGH